MRVKISINGRIWFIIFFISYNLKLSTYWSYIFLIKKLALVVSFIANFWSQFLKDLFYKIPSTFCSIRVIDVIAMKHTPPRARGLASDFNSFTISLLKPIADIAITIKNLDKSLKGLKNSIFTPLARAMVVIKLARMK